MTESIKSVLWIFLFVILFVYPASAAEEIQSDKMPSEKDQKIIGVKSNEIKYIIDVVVEDSNAEKAAYRVIYETGKGEQEFVIQAVYGKNGEILNTEVVSESKAMGNVPIVMPQATCNGEIRCITDCVKGADGNLHCRYICVCCE